MEDLIEIIRTECLPERNCMLTIFDEIGDSGFLYFKDAQLIEVNAGKLWGKPALELIFSKSVASYTLGEVPLGIKRTLWEPLDKMINEVAGEGAGAALIEAVKQLPSEGRRLSSAARIPLELSDIMTPLVQQLTKVDGLTGVLRETNTQIKMAAGSFPSPAFSEDWFWQLSTKIQSLGDSLGAGNMDEWNVELEECRIWRLKTKKSSIILFYSKAVDPEAFEEEARAVIGETK
jgi:hypothetical protein